MANIILPINGAPTALLWPTAMVTMQSASIAPAAASLFQGDVQLVTLPPEPPPIAGEGAGWLFDDETNSAHLLTCGVL